jgi:Coenzyme PQQ synthesis protein D (PqqD)
MAKRRGQQTDVLGARARVPEHVVYRQFPVETVMLNLETGRYHGLNPTAGAMLTELESSESVAEALVRLAAHYDVPSETLERDLCELCLDLRARGLIELTELDGRPTGGTDDPR